MIEVEHGRLQDGPKKIQKRGTYQAKTIDRCLLRTTFFGGADYDIVNSNNTFFKQSQCTYIDECKYLINYETTRIHKKKTNTSARIEPASPKLGNHHLSRIFPPFPKGEDLTRFVPKHATRSESGRRGRIGFRQIHRHGILDEEMEVPPGWPEIFLPNEEGEEWTSYIYICYILYIYIYKYYIYKYT